MGVYATKQSMDSNSYGPQKLGTANQKRYHVTNTALFPTQTICTKWPNTQLPHMGSNLPSPTYSSQTLESSLSNQSLVIPVGLQVSQMVDLQ